MFLHIPNGHTEPSRVLPSEGGFQILKKFYWRRTFVRIWRAVNCNGHHWSFDNISPFAFFSFKQSLYQLKYFRSSDKHFNVLYQHIKNLSRPTNCGGNTALQEVKATKTVKCYIVGNLQFNILSDLELTSLSNELIIVAIRVNKKLRLFFKERCPQNPVPRMMFFQGN